MGKLEGNISQLERQLRDYNRNTDARFSVLTDGRKWRLYYSLTPGEFSRKCFKSLDILEEDVDDLEISFYSFLSKNEISNGKAERDAKSYLQQNQKQRAVKDVLPKARRMINEYPYPSLPQAMHQLVTAAGFSITSEEVKHLLQEIETQKPLSETRHQTSLSKAEKSSENKRKSSGKPGVIDKIVEIIREHQPIEEDAILYRLSEAFPERDRSGMAETIKAQVKYGRLHKERGIPVEKTNAGYIIESQ